MPQSPVPAASGKGPRRAVKDMPWTPDLGNGQYRNPVIFADYSDPDVCRDGDDFWMTASSFNCTPGLPILHSRDLVNWTIVNHAVTNLPHDRYTKVQPGSGVWAPAIRFRNGLFYVYWPTPDEGIFMATARNPAGPWSKPVKVVDEPKLEDPCPFWDDDGSAWLVHSRVGAGPIVLRRMSRDGRQCSMPER